MSPQPDATGDERVETMQVLDAAPALGAQLTEADRAAAREAAIAPVMAVRSGPQAFRLEPGGSHGHLGLLVLDGLIARRLGFGSLAATELLGPGDLLRPWSVPRGREPATAVSWEALTPARVACLDPAFAARISPWPQLVAALLDRAVERTEFQLLLAAVRQARRVEDRVLLVLWHCAGRWGETAGGERTLELPGLTGYTLAQLTGARRQSVSTALDQLAERGAIQWLPSGALLIFAPAFEVVRPMPSLVAQPANRRASDLAAAQG